jgi:hypothetical protein
MMAMLMDQGFATAATMRLSGWTNIRKPPSARYTSANFDPSLVIPESTPRLATASAQPLAGFTAAAPPAAPAPQPEQRVASLAPQPAQGSVAPPQGGPSIGSWVLQVGSFSDAQAAQLAIERAASTLSDMSSVTTAVDEVQMANKTFHRARLTNLSQGQAVDGCKRLEKKKIYCSAIQVTAWNTPGAR